MFQALVVGKTHDLRQMGLRFIKKGHKTAALLCFDFIGNTPPPIREAKTIEEGLAILELFFKYAQLLHDAAFIKDPSEKYTIQRLFGFTPCGEGLYDIPRGTSFTTKDGMLTLSSRDLSLALKEVLSDLLRIRVMELYQLCERARIFSPCIRDLVDNCRTVDCRHGHFGSSTLDPRWYNTRVRLCLLEIRIFQQLHFTEIWSNSDCFWKRR